MGYLASQGVRLTGSARAGDVEILPGFAGSRIGLWRSNARRSVLNHIQQLWPGEAGALMQAMLIRRVRILRQGTENQNSSAREPITSWWCRRSTWES